MHRAKRGSSIIGQSEVRKRSLNKSCSGNKGREDKIINEQ